MTEEYKIVRDAPTLTAGKIELLFTLDERNYTINGLPKTMDVAPVSIDGRTFLPIRYCAEPLGAVVDWDENEKKVTVTHNNTVIELVIGSNIALVNGKEVQLDAENQQIQPVILSGRTMLPLRFVAESLGCQVEWQPATRGIKVVY
jgi:hypothetical protein